MTAHITYVGHGTVLIELGGARLLTDPLLATSVLGFIRRAGEVTQGVEEGIDAVLLSHLHPDHLHFPSLRRVGADTRVIAAPGAARLLRRRGFGVVEELASGESTHVGSVEILATPAVHDGRRWPIGPAVPALGFALGAGDLRIYFAGDTDLFDEMADLAPLDLALLPIAGWGGEVGRGHLDPRRAVDAAALLRARMVVPIHWGTLLRWDLHPRRPELLEIPAREFQARFAERAPAVDARVLHPGESLTLDR